MTTIIRGGTIVNADRAFKGDVLVFGDKIVAVGDKLDAPSGATVIDASGQYVMPGGIDTHTHMQLPFMGTVTADDFFTWHRGKPGRHGTTTIMDFVIPESAAVAARGVSHLARLGRQIGGRLYLPRGRHLVGRQRACGHGHAGAQAWREQLQALYGVQERHHGRRRNAGQKLHPALELGAIPTVHAENGELVFQLQQDLLRKGITGPAAHPLSRPPEVEAEAANRAIAIANVLGTPVYIVHVSCAESLEAITRARQGGQRVWRGAGLATW
ncbi:hypothetical protein LP419_10560 [Massilia sp. H-1]|nr:hypothetical protein LP419_10560 [Massilia sp. H-1]